MGEANLTSQAELARQNEFLNGLIDSIADILFCKDTEGRYLGCNGAFAQRVGIRKEAIVGRTDFDLFPGEEAESYRRDDRTALAQNGCLSIEQWISYPDGRRVLLETCKTPYWGSDGRLLGLIGIGRDITARKKNEEQSLQMASQLQEVVAQRTHELLKTNRELQQEVVDRKRSEGALKETEDRYRALFDRSHDIVYIHDFDGHFIDANPAALSSMGYEKEDLPSLNLSDVIDPDQLSVIQKTLRELEQTGTQKVAAEFRVKRKNGEYVILETMASVIYREGVPLAIQGVARDVTEHRQAERIMIAQRDLGIALDGATSLQHALRLCLDAAINVSGLDSGGIYIMDPVTGDFHLADHTGLSDEFIDAVRYIPANSDRARIVMMGKPVYLEMTAPLVHNHPEQGREGLKSIAVIPIYSQGRLVGDMNIASHVLDRIPVHGGNALEIIAAQIGMSIMKAKAEETLRESEKKYRESQQKLSDIIDFLPDATFVIDREGKIIAWNRAIEEMTGAPAADMLGKGDYAYAVPFYGRRQPILIDLVLNPCKEIEARYVSLERKDSVLAGEAYMPDLRGRESYLFGLASILKDSQGNVVGAIESIRDITDRKRVEGRYRSIFENAVMGIFQSTPEGRIINANPAFARILGYDSPEDVLTSLTDMADQMYVQPERRAELLQIMNEQGPHPEQEVHYYRKDRSTVWVAVTGCAIRDNEGRIICYQETVQDINERKHLEGRLRQAQKMEAIGTLAGGIAHDFNNILSAVIGYAELALAEQGGNDRLHSYLEHIYKAGQRAGDLVKQILTFSRRTDEKLRPLRASLVVKEILKLLRASLPTTVEVRQSIQSDPDTVLAGPSHIHQILMNLCTNAAHAMRDKKGVLSVSLAPVEIKPGDALTGHGLIPGMHLKLSVRDTGHGIDPGIIEKIYDPFFTTKKPGEGTGMGLSVVHGIVMSCHGAITVQSEVGKGTEFHVYLPLLIGTERENKETVAVPTARGNERILFVDDEEELVNLGTEMLTGLGYQVIGRTSSREALELFRARPSQFDLVITDMTMPNLTGIELAQELMRIRPDLPVILCTGFSETITPQRAKSLGMREFAMKPIVTRQIAAAVRRALDPKE